MVIKMYYMLMHHQVSFIQRQVTRIQVNTGTKIVIPAAGDKAVIKLTVNKNVGTDKDSILGNTLNITGSDKVLRKMECISCVENSDKNYVDVEFECYLTGDEESLH